MHRIQNNVRRSIQATFTTNTPRNNSGGSELATITISIIVIDNSGGSELATITINIIVIVKFAVSTQGRRNHHHHLEYIVVNFL